MTEANVLKGEINNNIEIKNENHFTGIQANLDSLVQTLNEGLLYLGDKLGKPLTDVLGCTVQTWIIEQCHTRPYFAMAYKANGFSFLKNNVAPKLFAIPEENRVFPNMRIAKNVFENVIDLEPNEETLREMFANLLAGSMDNRKSEGVHPDYARLIAGLSEEDAKFLVRLFKEKRIPSLFVREYSDEEGFKSLLNKNLTEGYTTDIYWLEAKGLLNRKGGLFQHDPDNEGHLKPNQYTEVVQRLEEQAEANKTGHRIKTNPNLLALTPDGEAFMQAVT